MHDSEASLNATVRAMRQNLADAVEDGMIIASPHHMRELYFTTYSLPFLVGVAPFPLTSIPWTLAPRRPMACPLMADVVACGMVCRLWSVGSPLSGSPHARPHGNDQPCCG